MDVDRLLGPHRQMARRLFDQIRELPLVCPHGHVDPELLASPEASFSDPVSLFIRPDHYLLRMLYSQGEDLAYFLERRQDPREVWRRFVGHLHLFWGTPSGLWLDTQLQETFGLSQDLSPDTADEVYDALCEKLASQEYRPRALFERFGIEVLCTTDAATDTLEHHRRIRDSGWTGRVLPTFRPDALLSVNTPGWPNELARLQNLVSVNVSTWKGFLDGLRERRAFFKLMGCLATDHGCPFPVTERLEEQTAGDYFDLALRGKLEQPLADHLHAHLLTEMAAMSCEDGLVMQLHSGSHRNHNTALFEQFGPDKGADIPHRVDFTSALKPLLNSFGTHPNFKLIVFTLDESTYSRELAPLAGHYPAMLLGPPWWFHDSVNGMLRYFEQVMETAGVFNTAGFNDDTRAFCSIPARHDVWRRVSCRWLSGLVVEGVLSEEKASRLAFELAVGRARDAYNLSAPGRKFASEIAPRGT